MIGGFSADAASHWPALTKWTNAYLVDKLKDVGTISSSIGPHTHALTLPHAEVTVDFSADGYSDAIVGDRFFVTPESRKMSFSHFLSILLDRGNCTKGIVVLFGSVSHKSCTDFYFEPGLAFLCVPAAQGVPCT